MHPEVHRFLYLAVPDRLRFKDNKQQVSVSVHQVLTRHVRYGTLILNILLFLLGSCLLSDFVHVCHDFQVSRIAECDLN